MQVRMMQTHLQTTRMRILYMAQARGTTATENGTIKTRTVTKIGITRDIQAKNNTTGTIKAMEVSKTGMIVDPMGNNSSGISTKVPIVVAAVVEVVVGVIMVDEEDVVVVVVTITTTGVEVGTNLINPGEVVVTINNESGQEKITIIVGEDNSLLFSAKMTISFEVCLTH